MMEPILPELEFFILNFCKEHKIKHIPKDLDLNTSVDLDLDIHDLDMDLFISEFVEKFNIDYSSFSWQKYGYPKGSTIIGILRIFFGYKLWVKKVGNRLYRPKFKVQYLQDAIKTGILI